LLIDTDRILPGPVASQGFKAVAWKTCQIGEGNGRIEYFSSFPALPIKTLECPHELALCEYLRTFVPKAQDHPEAIYPSGRYTSNVHASQPTSKTAYIQTQLRAAAVRLIPLPPFAAAKIPLW
jgi:hypothetical protein